MSKPTKIYIAFTLIFLVGFLTIYIYITFFLNHRFTTSEIELKKPLSAIITML